MSSSAPQLGQAPLPAASAAELLRRNATEEAIRDRPALHHGDRSWTHAEYHAECARYANLFLQRRVPDAPFHVAVLLDNTPEYVFAIGGAALCGATLVGVNHTRRGEQLLHDVRHTDCQLLLHTPRHEEAVASVIDAIPQHLEIGPSLEAALAGVSTADPHVESDIDDTWCLIFTSGTSAAPKAVICSQRRILQSGARMAALMELTPDDVGYVCMPLFHSNGLTVGWAPSIVTGASVALADRFSASGWLPDVRRYGVTYFNYTGKPLAYILAQPERPDDADNHLRVAFGNEGAPQVVEAFAQRFGVHVIDAFGATEGGLAVNRDDDAPVASVGRAGPAVKVFGDGDRELPRATFDETGALVDPEGCVGEIVNTAGVGVFEGYYANPEATARATRNGWYWSGDLGYIDEAGYLYFAGRTADWIRVDGENFPAGPVEVIVSRHPDVMMCAVYGVPDVDAGDRVMATLVLRDGASFEPGAFAAWVDAQADLGPKGRPTYVRVTGSIPTSPTNKVLTRILARQKYRPDLVDGDPVWFRRRGDDAYRRFAATDADELRVALEEAGRGRFWDL